MYYPSLMAAQAVAEGYKIVVPKSIRTKLRISAEVTDKILESPSSVKVGDKLIFIAWEEADSNEKKAWSDIFKESQSQRSATFRFD